jgi:hypothetical protein
MRDSFADNLFDKIIILNYPRMSSRNISNHNENKLYVVFRKYQIYA